MAETQKPLYEAVPKQASRVGALLFSLALLMEVVVVSVMGPGVAPAHAIDAGTKISGGTEDVTIQMGQTLQYPFSSTCNLPSGCKDITIDLTPDPKIPVGTTLTATMPPSATYRLENATKGEGEWHPRLVIESQPRQTMSVTFSVKTEDTPWITGDYDLGWDATVPGGANASGTLHRKVVGEPETYLAKNTTAYRWATLEKEDRERFADLVTDGKKVDAVAWPGMQYQYQVRYKRESNRSGAGDGTTGLLTTIVDQYPEGLEFVRLDNFSFAENPGKSPYKWIDGDDVTVDEDNRTITAVIDEKADARVARQRDKYLYLRYTVRVKDDIEPGTVIDNTAHLGDEIETLAGEKKKVGDEGIPGPVTNRVLVVDSVPGGLTKTTGSRSILNGSNMAYRISGRIPRGGHVMIRDHVRPQYCKYWKPADNRERQYSDDYDNDDCYGNSELTEEQANQQRYQLNYVELVPITFPDGTKETPSARVTFYDKEGNQLSQESRGREPKKQRYYASNETIYFDVEYFDLPDSSNVIQVISGKWTFNDKDRSKPDYVKLPGPDQPAWQAINDAKMAIIPPRISDKYSPPEGPGKAGAADAEKLWQEAEADPKVEKIVRTAALPLYKKVSQPRIDLRYPNFDRKFPDKPGEFVAPSDPGVAKLNRLEAANIPDGPFFTMEISDAKSEGYRPKALLAMPRGVKIRPDEVAYYPLTNMSQCSYDPTRLTWKRVGLNPDGGDLWEVTLPKDSKDLVSTRTNKHFCRVIVPVFVNGDPRDPSADHGPPPRSGFHNQNFANVSGDSIDYPSLTGVRATVTTEDPEESVFEREMDPDEYHLRCFEGEKDTKALEDCIKEESGKRYNSSELSLSVVPQAAQALDKFAWGDYDGPDAKNDPSLWTEFPRDVDSEGNPAGSAGLVSPASARGGFVIRAGSRGTLPLTELVLYDLLPSDHTKHGWPSLTPENDDTLEKVESEDQRVSLLPTLRGPVELPSVYVRGVKQTIDAEVYYSTNTNPCRPELSSSGNTPFPSDRPECTRWDGKSGEWKTEDQVQDWSAIRAIRISVNTELSEEVDFKVDMDIPTLTIDGKGLSASDTAVNRVASYSRTKQVVLGVSSPQYARLQYFPDLKLDKSILAGDVETDGKIADLNPGDEFTYKVTALGGPSGAVSKDPVIRDFIKSGLIVTGVTQEGSTGTVCVKPDANDDFGSAPTWDSEACGDPDDNTGIDDKSSVDVAGTRIVWRPGQLSNRGVVAEGDERGTSQGPTPTLLIKVRIPEDQQGGIITNDVWGGSFANTPPPNKDECTVHRADQESRRRCDRQILRIRPSISGAVFDDLNADSHFEATDEGADDGDKVIGSTADGYPELQATLVAVDDNGDETVVRRNGEDFTVPIVDGQYKFNNVDPGRYKVRFTIRRASEDPEDGDFLFSPPAAHPEGGKITDEGRADAGNEDGSLTADTAIFTVDTKDIPNVDAGIYAKNPASVRNALTAEGSFAFDYVWALAKTAQQPRLFVDPDNTVQPEFAVKVTAADKEFSPISATVRGTLTVRNSTTVADELTSVSFANLRGVEDCELVPEATDRVVPPRGSEDGYGRLKLDYTCQIDPQVIAGATSATEIEQKLREQLNTGVQVTTKRGGATNALEYDAQVPDSGVSTTHDTSADSDSSVTIKDELKRAGDDSVVESQDSLNDETLTWTEVYARDGHAQTVRYQTNTELPSAEPGDCSTYVNTAVLRSGEKDVVGTQDTAEQRVCTPGPLNTKIPDSSVTANFEVVRGWEVEKRRTNGAIEIDDATGMVKIPYRITTTATGKQKLNPVYTATIEVTNPNPPDNGFADIVVAVAARSKNFGDRSRNGECRVEDPTGGAPIAAGKTVNFIVECPVEKDFNTNSLDDELTYTLTRPDRPGFEPVVKTVPVEGTTTEFNNTIKVWDENARDADGNPYPAEEYKWTEEGKTYTRDLTWYVDPPKPGTCTSYENNAHARIQDPQSSADTSDDADTRVALVSTTVCEPAEPTATAQATAHFDRVFAYTVEKSGSGKPAVDENGVVTRDYDVTVNQAGTKALAGVYEGSVTVTNNNGASYDQFTPARVKLDLDPGVAGSTCQYEGQDKGVLVNSGVSREIPFTCTIPEDLSYTGTDSDSFTLKYVVKNMDDADKVITSGDVSVPWQATDYNKSVVVKDDRAKAIGDNAQSDLPEGVVMMKTWSETEPKQTVRVRPIERPTVEPGECLDLANQAYLDIPDAATEADDESSNENRRYQKNYADDRSETVKDTVCRSVEPEITATATSFYDRRYVWQQQKRLVSKALRNDVPDSQDAHVQLGYEIKAIQDGVVVENQAVAGEITVINRNNDPAIKPQTFQITQLFSEGSSTCAPVGRTMDEPFTLASGERITIPVTCAYSTDYDEVPGSELLYSVSRVEGDTVTPIAEIQSVPAEPVVNEVNKSVIQYDREIPGENGRFTIVGNDDGVGEHAHDVIWRVTDRVIPAGQCVQIDNTVEMVGQPGTPFYAKEFPGEATHSEEVCNPVAPQISNLNVDASYDEIAQWSLAKTATGAQLADREGSTDSDAIVDYEVTTTQKDSQRQDYTLGGSVTVTNPNRAEEIAPQPLQLAVQSSIDGVTCTVAGENPVTIPQGESVTKDIDCQVPADYRGDLASDLTVKVSTEANSDIPLAERTAAVTATTKRFNDRITVTDKQTDQSWTYTADSDPRTHVEKVSWVAGTVDVGRCKQFTNTAEAEFTDAAGKPVSGELAKYESQAPKPVKATSESICNEAQIGVDTKNADASLTRVFGWELDKSVENITMSKPGADGARSAAADYTVTVREQSPENSDLLYTGSLTVTNPNDFADRYVVVRVESAIADTTCTVDGNKDGGVRLTPSGSQEFPFSCQLPKDYDGPLTDTLTYTVTPVPAVEGSTPVTGTIDVTGTVSGFNREVVVKDEMIDLDETVTWSDGKQVHTFTKTADLGTIPAGECKTVVNEADLAAATTGDSDAENKEQNLGTAQATAELCNLTATTKKFVGAPTETTDGKGDGQTPEQAVVVNPTGEDREVPVSFAFTPTGGDAREVTIANPTDDSDDATTAGATAVCRVRGAGDLHEGGRDFTLTADDQGTFALPADAVIRNGQTLSCDTTLKNVGATATVPITVTARGNEGQTITVKDPLYLTTKPGLEIEKFFGEWQDISADAEAPAGHGDDPAQPVVLPSAERPELTIAIRNTAPEAVTTVTLADRDDRVSAALDNADNAVSETLALAGTPNSALREATCVLGDSTAAFDDSSKTFTWKADENDGVVMDGDKPATIPAYATMLCRGAAQIDLKNIQNSEARHSDTATVTAEGSRTGKRTPPAEDSFHGVVPRQSEPKIDTKLYVGSVDEGDGQTAAEAVEGARTGEQQVDLSITNGGTAALTKIIVKIPKSAENSLELSLAPDRVRFSMGDEPVISGDRDVPGMFLRVNNEREIILSDDSSLPLLVLPKGKTVTASTTVPVVPAGEVRGSEIVSTGVDVVSGETVNETDPLFVAVPGVPSVATKIFIDEPTDNTDGSGDGQDSDRAVTIPARTSSEATITITNTGDTDLTEVIPSFPGDLGIEQDEARFTVTNAEGESIAPTRGESAPGLMLRITENDEIVISDSSDLDPLVLQQGQVLTSKVPMREIEAGSRANGEISVGASGSGKKVTDTDPLYVATQPDPQTPGIETKLFVGSPSDGDGQDEDNAVVVPGDNPSKAGVTITNTGETPLREVSVEFPGELGIDPSTVSFTVTGKDGQPVTPTVDESDEPVSGTVLRVDGGKVVISDDPSLPPLILQPGQKLTGETPIAEVPAGKVVKGSITATGHHDGEPVRDSDPLVVTKKSATSTPTPTPDPKKPSVTTKIFIGTVTAGDGQTPDEAVGVDPNTSAKVTITVDNDGETPLREVSVEFPGELGIDPSTVSFTVTGKDGQPVTPTVDESDEPVSGTVLRVDGGKVVISDDPSLPPLVLQPGQKLTATSTTTAVPDGQTLTGGVSVTAEANGSTVESSDPLNVRSPKAPPATPAKPKLTTKLYIGSVVTGDGQDADKAVEVPADKPATATITLTNTGNTDLTAVSVTPSGDLGIDLTTSTFTLIGPDGEIAVPTQGEPTEGLIFRVTSEGTVVLSDDPDLSPLVLEVGQSLTTTATTTALVPGAAANGQISAQGTGAQQQISDQDPLFVKTPKPKVVTSSSVAPSSEPTTSSVTPEPSSTPGIPVIPVPVPVPVPGTPAQSTSSVETTTKVSQSTTTQSTTTAERDNEPQHPKSRSALARTGANVLGLLAIAVFLVLMGIALVGWRRKQQKDDGLV